MTRETSIEAYEVARDSGLIGSKQDQVLKILAEHGPLTSNEIFNFMRDEALRSGAKDFRFDSNTRARLTELREMDLVKEEGTVTDPITHRRVILWEISGKPPRPRQHKRKEEVAANG